MNIRLITLSVLTALCGLSVRAQTVMGNGTKQAPFKTIEQALAVAAPGDTIHLTAGNYRPEASTFDIDKSLTLIGGYDENFTQTSPGTTFLSKNEPGTVEYDNITETVLTRAANPYGLIRIQSETAELVVENVKIQKGEVHSGVSLTETDGWLSFYDRTLHVRTEQPYRYAVYDPQGRCVTRAVNRRPDVPVCLEHLPKGFYLLHVHTDARQSSLKIWID